MMTTAKIAARIASAIAPEIEAMLREQADTITDLEQRLGAANDRATAAESRLDQLRQLLNPSAPVEPVKAPMLMRDDLIAAFHAKREIGPCSIKELCVSIGVNEPHAQHLYNQWCAWTGKTRINYSSSGRRINVPVAAAVPLPPSRRDEQIAAFHTQRSTGPVHIKMLADVLRVSPDYAQQLYSAWAKKNGVTRIDYLRTT